MLTFTMMRNFLLVTPAVLGAALWGTGTAIATEVPTPKEVMPSNLAVKSPALGTIARSPAVSQSTTPAESDIPTVEQVLQNVGSASAAAMPEVSVETNKASMQLVTPSDTRLSVMQIAELSSLEEGATPMGQVTSVSQLSDVQPTDWAFQALQSLVERYGCIAGYPDGTYRGNRAMTRYEFAAGLNACMDRVNELLAAATAELVRKEDLATLQRLQEEFAAELATLRGRVDALEARTAELEANQFSTTTKLTGGVWFNLTGAFAGDDVKAEFTGPLVPGDLALRSPGRTATGAPIITEVDDPNVTFSGLVWLNFNTSFTGRDSLFTQLAAGNGNSPANYLVSAGLYNTWGVPFFDQTAGQTNGVPSVIIRELFYSFPLTNNLQIVVGPHINWYRYFDDNRYTFVFTGAGSFNSSGSTLLNSIDRGSGIVALWDINRLLKFRAAYMGENTEFLGVGVPGLNTASDPQFGLFGGTNTATAELTISPTSNFNVRLLYNRANIQAVGGLIGGATSEPINGFADSRGRGALSNATANVFNINFDWALSPRFGIFARYSYSTTDLWLSSGRGRSGVISAQAYQFGLAFPDLGKRGAQGVVTLLVPFSVTDGRSNLAAGGGNGGKQYDFEASYFYPMTDNIAIVPSFYAIFNANNFDNNPTVFIGNLRTQFTF